MKESPLSLWRDGGAKSRILDFVKKTNDRSSKHYVPREERIAVFDNDGTLWCERPVPFQATFILERLISLAKTNPELREKIPFQLNIDHAQAWMAEVITRHYRGEEVQLDELATLLLMAFEDIEVHAYQKMVRDFLAFEKNSELNMPYLNCVYLPMLQLLQYLAENGFKNYIVSGGGAEFIRAVSEPLYGIPKERVIGSTVAMQTKKFGDYSQVFHTSRLDVLDDGAVKPLKIWNHIGRRPIFAAGNSNGDLDMLEYTLHPSHLSLGLVIEHDDREREFQYQKGAEKLQEKAKSRHWQTVSMRNDWKSLFPLGLSQQKEEGLREN